MNRIRFMRRLFAVLRGRGLLEIFKFFLVEFVDRLSKSGIASKGPSQIFFFVLVIAVKNYFLLLFTVGEDAFPLMESYIFLFEDLDDLVHLVSVLEVEEEAPFGINKISCVLLWYECEWKSVFHSNAIFQRK